MSAGLTRVYLVWTQRGRRFYVLADNGPQAIQKVNRQLNLRSQERNSKESNDHAMNAFDWTDQEVLPAGRWRGNGTSIAD